MALGYLLVALLAAAVAVFALQNSAQTSVTFLVWTLDGLPVAAVALASLGIGLLVAGRAPVAPGLALALAGPLGRGPGRDAGQGARRTGPGALAAPAPAA